MYVGTRVIERPYLPCVAWHGWRDYVVCIKLIPTLNFSMCSKNNISSKKRRGDTVPTSRFQLAADQPPMYIGTLDSSHNAWILKRKWVYRVRRN